MGGRFFMDYLGGLNLIQGVVNFVRSAAAGDLAGHVIALPRFELDGVRERYQYTGSHWNCRMMIDTLRAYHVAVIAYGFDESHTWIKVAQRQARWAEYVLLRAGCPFQSETVDERNAAWAANPAHGGAMPARWDDREKHNPPSWAREE